MANNLNADLPLRLAILGKTPSEDKLPEVTKRLYRVMLHKADTIANKYGKGMENGYKEVILRLCVELMLKHDENRRLIKDITNLAFDHIDSLFDSAL